MIDAQRRVERAVRDAEHFGGTFTSDRAALFFVHDVLALANAACTFAFFAGLEEERRKEAEAELEAEFRSYLAL